MAVQNIWFLDMVNCSGKDNLIIHAHIILGKASSMISSAENYPNPTFCKSPREIGGVGTAELIIYVEEVDKHYIKAKSQEANIVVDIASFLDTLQTLKQTKLFRNFDTQNL